MVFIANKSGPKPKPEDDFMLPDGLTMLKQIELEEWAESEVNKKIQKGDISTLEVANHHYWVILYFEKEKITNG